MDKKGNGKFVKKVVEQEAPKRKRSYSSQNGHAGENVEEVIAKKVKKNKYVDMNVEDDRNAQKLEQLPNKLEDYIKDPKTIEILKGRGIKYLFPIQEQCFKPAYAGQDIIGKDRTGSGKTLAFSLPLIEKYRKQGLFNKIVKGQKPYMLVLLPTRELAIQVANEIKTLMHSPNEFRVACIYGGTEVRTQSDAIRDGVEIVVGTPGRIMDQYQRKALSFNKLLSLVLDEADQMLQVGFQEDVEKIYEYVTNDIEIPKTQNLLFSATIPSWLHEISKKYIASDRVFIDLIKSTSIQTSTTVEHLAINCPYYQRTDAMGDVIMCYGGGVNSRCIIFCETKKEANDILLEGKIKQDCQVLHGDIPQKQREITFQGFRDGKFKCLIATNVAARGLDIPAVDLIVQTEPPKDIDTYIHRSGRTARAGRTGVCITFYTKKNQGLLDRIERKIGVKMRKVGAPQPEDLLKASSRDIVLSLRSVSVECSELFKEVAQELIAEVGAEEALARAISYIAGYTEKMKQRSLLCSMEGYVTYLVKTDKPFRNKGFVWAYLKRVFAEDIEGFVKGMKMFKDSCGAVFDVAEEKKQLFDDFIKQIEEEGGDPKNPIKLELATTIPELQDDGPAQSYQSNQQSNGYSSQRSSFKREIFDEFEVKEAKKNKRNQEVFIGRLSFNINEEKLREFFSKNGVEFFEARMLKDDAGNFKGCCFALCKNEDMAQKACSLDGSVLDGRKIVINMSDSKAKK